MRFLHAADIHLDSPLRGLAKYDGAPVDEIRQATRKALQNLAGLAIDEQVDLVLIAGDLYDGDWQDHNTGLFFSAQMARLNDAGIPVVMIRGNHDAAARMTKSLRLPDNVTRLDHKRPETVKFEDLGIAVHGQSFAKQAVHENIAVNYPPAVSGMFNIGLLHTALTGAEGYDPYAPCTTDDLLKPGYDYWALGHVHERRIVNEAGVGRGEPPIVFSGNIQGRNIRETGPRGCYLVDIAPGQAPDLEFRPLDVFRWERCRIDADGLNSVDDVLEHFGTRLDELIDNADGRPLAVRTEITGRCNAHTAFAADPVQRREDFENQTVLSGRGQVWLEQVRFRTASPERPDEIPDDGLLESLQEVLNDLRQSPDNRQALLKLLEPLQSKLPRELTHGTDALPFFSNDDSEEWLNEVLESVEPLLLDYLRGGDPA